MEEKFTIEEIKNYIKSQDSLGDVVYFLTAENIKKANEPEKVEEEEVEVGRDVEFPHTEEMACPACKEPTPHSLAAPDGDERIPKSTKTWRWTCDICHHQLKNC
jgi:hypothetical protein